MWESFGIFGVPQVQGGLLGTVLPQGSNIDLSSVSSVRKSCLRV